ncbi:hypothetical protein [Methylocystis sp.]|uniref:hypothetical protein n=1 Tax=Methylocystis sp. TaxID=1911079 RepID=UPI0025CD4E39|nr:hypothetical protein [Methylocystis sp.]
MVKYVSAPPEKGDGMNKGILLRENVSGSIGGCNQKIDSFIDSIHAFTKRCNDALMLERQPFFKSYEEGRLDVCFFLPDSSFLCENKAIAPVPKPTVNINQRFVFRAAKYEYAGAGDRKAANATEFIGAHLGDMAGQNEQSMLVLSVEPVQRAEYFISSWIWLEGFDRLDDVCSGKLYLSLINGACKSLRFFGERECDEVGTGRSVARKLEHRQVECCAQVVNGVSCDKRKLVWNGYVGFNHYGSPIGLWIESAHEPEGFPFHEGFDLTLKIVDVMLGPFNL